MASDLWIPSLVGGALLPLDFGPSILFATLHASTLLVLIYRFCDKRFRTAVLQGTVGFTVERSIIFCLRAVESQTEADRDSKSVADYMQLTIGMGYLAMGQDLLNLLRCLLVNSTTEQDASSDDVPLTGLSTTLFQAPEATPRDRPRERKAYRRLADVLGILFIACMVTGGVGNATIGAAVEDKGKAKLTSRLRYASSALALALIFSVGWIALWARFKRPRVRQNAASILAALAFLLAIVPAYRLAVMYNKTASFSSTAPGSLNTPMEKAGFYVFHIVPEWILVTALSSMRTREVFNTGPNGDFRWRDETPEEKASREKREQEKREKKEEKQRQKELKQKKGAAWTWKSLV